MFGKKQDGKICLTTLVDGLPLNQDTNLIMKLTADKLLFIVSTTKQEFEIDFSKLTAVEYKTETEMNNIISQSAPGMIIGAAAFGILGAMIGGRVKTKQVKTVSHFLIINYQSGEEKQIVLQTNDGNSAKQISEYFRQLKPLPDKISL